jgi:hypothetical protein
MDNNLSFTDEFDIERVDELDSLKYLNVFNSFITNSNCNVFALSGSWGSGKTSFIQMWENMLKNENKLFVHIDAFKMDYESDTFIMFIMAFKNALKDKKGIDETKYSKFINTAKNIFSIRNLLKFGINFAIEKTGGMESIKEFINDTATNSFDLLTEEKTLYDKLHSSLIELMDDKEPLYIIIDELDRCRPDFALETLEKIKHIFFVKNVKYILVYSDIIMRSIINKKYGSIINAHRYLQKFIQKTYFFDNKERELRKWYIKEVQNILGNYDTNRRSITITNCDKPLFEICKKYNLKLRDIQHLLYNLSSHNFSNDKMIVTLFCFELLSIINIDEYRIMINEHKEYGNNTTGKSTSRENFYNLLMCFHEFIEKDNKYYDSLFFDLMQSIEIIEKSK